MVVISSLIFIGVIFFVRIAAIINEIKIPLQARPDGWGTKSSCRGRKPMMKMMAPLASVMTILMMHVQVLKKRTRGLAMLSSFCILGKTEAKG